ncbi:MULTISPECIES: hypothetical protein [unclassified Streptomyces]|uniref:hypothetical protein n=1 Tax=unclassified Streptomyces TaxID=2593676 RepID=UPI003D9099A3
MSLALSVVLGTGPPFVLVRPAGGARPDEVSCLLPKVPILGATAGYPAGVG